MNLLGRIQTAAWARAKESFEHPRNKYEIKYSKKRNPRYAKIKHPENFHSFIKIKNTIYAMANQQYIGEGSFGAVKIIQNEKGENFALKIEKIIPDVDMNLANKHGQHFLLSMMSAHLYIERQRLRKETASTKKVISTH